ncbi:acetolactate synthase large subunit [Orbus hercynius]|uniref:Acetolactate synthase n=1 Tax=Orbus hercynius TaxID=593135 RepID=A0A495RIG0_9GAMM|nr:acetolactate synthase 2 catalytic subunit [Orbus hercynius]RKS86976.1 acetolactate synthase large subunit [Orbus hercynius]
MTTGAQWIVKSLKQQGVKTVFGYPGGQIMPLYDALYDGGLEHLLCRHEQGAAMAAIGYARSTGKTGVCIATSGPGATNLLTGLADALVDSVPVVAITGQVPRALIGTDAFQEVDILGMSFACTKHSFLVDDPTALPDILEQAFAIANSGRPGPVLIDVPKDIQLAQLDFEHCLTHSHYYHPFDTLTHSLTSTTTSQIRAANDLINQAKKPILYIGGGVMMADAVMELRELVTQTGIPAVTTLKGIGALDINHPYYLGMVGMHGFKSANLAVQQCDLLIAIGVRFDDRVTGNLNQFATHANVIHIDIDPAELCKLKLAHIAIQADAKLVIPMLKQSVDIGDWQQHILSLKQQYVPRYDHPGEAIYAPLMLKQLSNAILAQAAIATFVTTDVGQHQMWAAQHMLFKDPNTFISSSGLGTMGFGLPAAIGAQIARPDDCVICISGDGSFMMNIQELATIKRRNLPIKMVLIDNSRLGMVRQWQQLFFKERYSETDLSDNPDFLVLASAFNIPGRLITTKAEVLPAIEQLLTTEGAFLLHVKIDAMENVWPLVPPGAANHDMLESITE